MSATVLSRLRRAGSVHSRPVARSEAPPPLAERSPDALPASAAPASRRGFHAECTTAELGVRVVPVGEFDCAAVVDFERAMASMVALGCPIVIDLSRVSFIDSSGLWALTTTHTACRKLGIALTLLPGPDEVQSVFEVTGLYDLLPFAKGRDPALRARR